MKETIEHSIAIVVKFDNVVASITITFISLDNIFTPKATFCLLKTQQIPLHMFH